MAQQVNPFNLAPLAKLRGGAGSRFTRILGMGPNQGVYNALSRGIFARQVQRELAVENSVRDPDTRAAIAAINMVSGVIGLVNRDRQFAILDLARIMAHGFGDVPLRVADLGVDVEIQVTNLISGDWPMQDVMPCRPDAHGMIRFNAANFQAWAAQIVAVQNPRVAAQNVPSATPAGAAPVPGQNEITPWHLGGYLDLNVHDGTAVQALPANPLPTILEFLAIIALHQAQGVKRRAEIINLLVLGTTILTSGGNITANKVRKIIVTASRETMIDVDFSREMVLKGWDFLAMHCPGAAPGAFTSADFQQMSNLLSTATTPVSLRLTLLCQQTEPKMLTAIVTIVKAMRGSQDFPWTEFYEAIRLGTGMDELCNVSAYADYIDPPALTLQGIGHWSGWTFAQWTQPQQNMRIAMMPHALYVALRLSIQVGGNMSLSGYQGLDNITLPMKPLCDAWIMAYQGARQAAPAAQYPQNPAAPGATVQAVQAHNL